MGSSIWNRIKGKNKIEIEFKDEDDLQRLFNELIEAESKKN